jgi:hypothetical protein
MPSQRRSPRTHASPLEALIPDTLVDLASLAFGLPGRGRSPHEGLHVVTPGWWSGRCSEVSLRRSVRWVTMSLAQLLGRTEGCDSACLLCALDRIQHHVLRCLPEPRISQSVRMPRRFGARSAEDARAVGLCYYIVGQTNEPFAAQREDDDLLASGPPLNELRQCQSRGRALTLGIRDGSRKALLAFQTAFQFCSHGRTTKKAPVARGSPLALACET